MDTNQPDLEGALRKSFTVIQQLKQQLAESSQRSSEPIAVVGMGCRFPGGADTPEAFWQILSEGRDTLSEIPADRWDWRQYYNPDPDVAGTHYVRHGCFVERVGDFDPEFFGISGREADSLDPQHRLLLEVSWEALERAGLSATQARNSRTGVFLGIGQNDYAQLQMYGGQPERINPYDGTGISFCFAAARISYILGLQGPNLAVDTACSSALVALHLACQSLRNGECEQALAGGSHLVISPEVTIYLSRLHALSPDGRSKAFSADADGYGRGEGCGMLLLKRLSDATRDGDPVLAVIRGSAVNHDGASSGLTVPNGLAQQALLRDALARAGVQPAEIDWIEAHGTGTPLGDPIEVSALGEIFKADGRDGRPLYLSSVKTNIGHLEAAAGIAGVIKTILAFQHGAIPAHLHLGQPNPHIEWERYPFRIPTALTPWPGPRLAGVSAFGLGGTNAHIILAAPAAPTPPAAPSAEGYWPLLLSARSPAALAELRERYAAHLEHSAAPYADLAQTAALGRRHFEYRLAVAASTAAEAAAKLRQAALPSAPAVAPQRIAFLFTGQGSQYCGMGSALLQASPVFRAAVEECAALVEREAGWSPLPFLADDNVDPRIDQTAYTQPTLFTLQVGLVALWRSWGVVPDLAVGHSIGEFAAAWAAGIFSLADAVRLVVRRGRLMQALPAGGGMAALRCGAEQAQAAIATTPELCLAAINGPRAVTLAGPLAALDACLAALEAQGISGQRLAVSHAFHTPLMAPMLDEFSATLADIRFNPPNFSMLTSGGSVSPASAAYWRDQIVNPVRFAAAAEGLAEAGATLFIEIGPATALLSLARQSVDLPGALWLPSLDRHDPAAPHSSLARLFESGREIPWNAVFPGPRRVAQLPTYPFQRRRCWVAEKTQGNTARPNAGAHPLLGEAIPSPLAERQYAALVSPTLPGFLNDHRVLGVVVFPAAGFVEAALSAAAAHFATPRLRLAEIEFHQPLRLNGETRLHLILTPHGERCEIRIYSQTEGDWQPHMACSARPLAADSLTGLTPPCGAPLSSAPGAEFYQASSARGIDYGPAFQTLVRLDSHPGERGSSDYAVAPAHRDGRFLLHPLLLDTALQALGAARPDLGKHTYIPAGIAQLDFIPGAALGGRVLTEVESDASGGAILCALHLNDEQGCPCVVARGVRMQRIAALGTRHSPIWVPAWEAARPPAAGQPNGHWLVVGDAPEVADPLATLLSEAGATVSTLTLAQFPNDFAARWSSQGPISGIVWLALAPDSAATPCLNELALLQNLGALPETEQPRLLFATRGAQSVTNSGEQPELSRAALWGLARVARNEYPALACRCVDLDPVSSDADCARALLAECGGTGDEDQAAWRQDTRYALRLRPYREKIAPSRPQPSRIACKTIGDLDSLEFAAIPVPPPGSGEVQVRVRAAGLNFKDVLYALGVLELPADSAFGFDAAGTIEALGPDCGGYQIGERVMLTLTPGTLGDLVNARADFLCRIPAALDFPAAAGIPLAYLTAWHALVNVAKLQAGEAVLIHAGAGGVGQAAIHIARRLGAHVHTTASAPKQRHLRALGLAGIHPSRSTAFREAVLAAGGVDVVLNSLSGELIGAGFDCLKPHGRFVEIGKAGIWSDAAAAAYRSDVSYTVFDLADVARADPALIGTMFAEIAKGLADASLPPLPIQAFGADAVSDAFRLISRSRHIGKAVVVFPPPQAPDGVALISGGFGSLARLLCDDLLEQGTANLALLVRAPANAEQVQFLAGLRQRGARVAAYPADLNDPAALAATIAQIADDFGMPVNAVYHTAGTLADGAIANQTPQTFGAVAAPKLGGAWNLHLATRGLDLQRFVVFSSAAALIGTPGQNSYAVANAGLDGLAAARRGAGLAGLSVNWGPWGGEGMAARLAEVDRQRMASAGIVPLEGAPAWAALHHLAERGVPQAMVMDVDWARFAEQLPGARSASLFRDLAAAPAANPPAGTAPAPGLLEQIAALPTTGRRSALFRELQQRVATILGRPNPDDILPTQGFFAIGMDSLTSMELRNRLQRELACKLPATLAFDYGSIEALADHLLGSIPAWSSTPAAPAQDSAADLAGLSEDELAAMLARELGES